MNNKEYEKTNKELSDMLKTLSKEERFEVDKKIYNNILESYKNAVELPSEPFTCEKWDKESFITLVENIEKDNTYHTSNHEWGFPTKSLMESKDKQWKTVQDNLKSIYGNDIPSLICYSPYLFVEKEGD